MNNKILMGSIIAVSLLIGVSFTSVVGYNSVDSDVKISPLFNIRSSRAINQCGKGFTTDYIGKGNTFWIPRYDSKNTLIQKFIESVCKMDEITFQRFLHFLTNQMHMNDKSVDLNMNEIKTIIIQLRSNPNNIITQFSTGEDDNRQIHENLDYTIGVLRGLLRCLLVNIILGILLWWPPPWLVGIIIEIQWLLTIAPCGCSSTLKL